MTEENTEAYEHCKAVFDSKYMGVEALSSHNQKITLTIKSITNGSEKGSDGSNVKGRVIHFEENEPWIKPLWCGKHQCDLIIEAFKKKYGTNAKYHHFWIGEKVQLGACVETWFGKTEEYLRILPKLPVLTLPTLVPTDEKSWTGAVNYIVSGEGTIEDIKSKRTMLPENVIKLQVACDDAKRVLAEGGANA